jgi:predicted enzyme related to lactoylglutathione lyase
MRENEKPEIGSITWFDLTVPDAEKVKDFYSKVVWLESCSGFYG